MDAITGNEHTADDRKKLWLFGEKEHEEHEECGQVNEYGFDVETCRREL